MACACGFAAALTMAMQEGPNGSAYLVSHGTTKASTAKDFIRHGHPLNALASIASYCNLLVREGRTAPSGNVFRSREQ
jgi:hypothetical protein